jgi:hypothetical protein
MPPAVRPGAARDVLEIGVKVREATESTGTDVKLGSRELLKQLLINHHSGDSATDASTIGAVTFDPGSGPLGALPSADGEAEWPELAAAIRRHDAWRSCSLLEHYDAQTGGSVHREWRAPGGSGAPRLQRRQQGVQNTMPDWSRRCPLGGEVPIACQSDQHLLHTVHRESAVLPDAQRGYFQQIMGDLLPLPANRQERNARRVSGETRRD